MRGRLQIDGGVQSLKDRAMYPHALNDFGQICVRLCTHKSVHVALLFSILLFLDLLFVWEIG